MPFARCRFYTESGEPIRGGCHKKDAGCAFIHPDDPNWAKARESSFRAREKGGDAGKPWDRGRRGPQESSASATDSGSAWGSGWDMGEATSTPDSALSKGPSPWGTSSSATKTGASTNGGQCGWAATGWGNGQDGEKSAGSGTGDNGWGSSGWGNNQDADRTAGSGTGSTGDSGWGSSGWGNNQNTDKTAGSGDNGWGSSGWGNNQNADKTAESGTGSSGDSGWVASGWGNSQNADKTTGSGTESTGDSGWGSSGWGNNQNADKNTEPARGSGWGSGWGDNNGAEKNARGSARNDAWGSALENNKDSDKNSGSTWGNARDDGGSGWGNNDNATSSRRESQPMAMDSQVEKVSGHGKGKGKAVIAPPRIRIPDNENKRAKPSGTNNEPLGHNKWGESRPSNIAITSTPATAFTVATSTPTESTHGKRKRDVALDDKFEVFKEYIKLWERAVRAKFLLTEAEAKHDRWRRTQKSACYARVGEAGRDKLNGQRTELYKEHLAQSEKLTGAVSTLVDFHDKLVSNLDLGQRYNIGEEAQKFILESKAFVDEIRALLVARVLKEKDQEQPGDIEKQPSEADTTSIDSLRSRVLHLEERFEQAQTELTLRKQRDIRPEIDQLLTAKIQTLRAARQQETDRVASKPRPEIVIPPSALEEMEGTAQQVNEIETKVPHTVEDIRVLLFRVEAMTKRVSQLEEEVSTNKETYRKQVEGMAAQKEEAERQIDNKLQNIEGQFQQLIASQPPAPIPQTPTSPDVRLVENLQPLLEAVLTKFYEVQIRPAVEAVQQIAIEESDRHQAAAISVLWGRMKPAMCMVEGVSQWLDSQVLKSTAPVEEDMLIAD